MKQSDIGRVVSFSQNQWREKMAHYRRKIEIKAERTRCASVSAPQNGHVETTAPPLLKERQDS
jgi:hypothetical protein